MRWSGLLIAVAVVASLCWFFPLFHIVPLERAAKEKATATFDPNAFAEKFWNEQILTSLDKAVNAELLLPAIQSNAAEANKKFARSVGVSESYTYFITGIDANDGVFVAPDELIPRLGCTGI